MPRKPLKPCRYPGCPELTDEMYCSKHKKQKSSQYNRTQRSYQELYSNTRWQRLRKHFLSRYPLCAECKRQGRITPATVADHITPHKGDLELFWDEDNLQPLCKPCYDRKTAKEGHREKKGVVYSY